MGNSFFIKAILVALVSGAAVLAAGSLFCKYQISNNKIHPVATNYVLVVKPGTSLQQFTNLLQREKLFDFPICLRCYGIMKGHASALKAGEYTIEPGINVKQLLSKIVAGKVAHYQFAIIEGWTAMRVLSAMHVNPKIKHTLDGLNEAEIIAQLQIPVTSLEGMFQPDTYHFTSGTADVEFLRRAYNSLQLRLRMEWDSRSSDCILSNPYEALILASIIEKESAYYAEYPEISGVYQRRMQKKMRLQADPTIIYGLGAQYTGKLSKADLQLDTPYNTYTRAGLPPTPIAIPGMPAIRAALNPKAGDSLYFVAGQDGRHVFSDDLKDHNTAVQAYVSIK